MAKEGEANLKFQIRNIINCKNKEDTFKDGFFNNDLLEELFALFKKTDAGYQRFKTIIDQANFGLAIATLEGTITYINHYFAAVHGYQPSELIGKNLMLCHSEEQHEKVGELLALIRSQGGFQAEEVGHKKRDGKTFPMLMNGFFLEEASDDSEGPFIAATAIDLTKNYEAKQQLQKIEDRYRLITESIAEVIWVYNVKKKRFTFVSKSVENLLGYNTEEAMAKPILSFFKPQNRPHIAKDIARVVKGFMQDPQQSINNLRSEQIICKDNSLIWVELSTTYRFNNDNEVEMIAVTRDIEKRRQQEAEIKYLSTHDPLTGLLNRNAFTLLAREKTASQSTIKRQGVIFINIDKFRLVNDALGYRQGDYLLKDLAAKINKVIANYGNLYRYAGDEFVAVLEVNTEEQLMQLAKIIKQVVNRQFVIQHKKFVITSSLGVSFAQQGENLDQLIKNADTALYIAKKQRNTISFYNSEMENSRTREEILEQDLWSALEQKQLELYFQPIYDVQEQNIKQCEALLRWNHPIFGQVSPQEFIAIAEHNKLIIPITDWVIKKSCEQVLEWQQKGWGDFIISINLSLVSFENRGAQLKNFIMEMIEKYQIKASSLRLEITETTLMHDQEEILKLLNDLKSSGIKLALDDFGTGYSSFGYMKDLPLDIVKIDRSIIKEIAINQRAKIIVESMIKIIHSLDFKVVAEGVENKEELDCLIKLNCDFIQGYYFSKPLSSKAFENYLMSF